MLNRTQATAAQQLAAFAVALTFDDLPESVVARAKHRLIDAIACAVSSFDTLMNILDLPSLVDVV